MTFVYEEIEDNLYLNISSTSLQYFHSVIYNEDIFINLDTPNLKVIVNNNSNINLLNYFNGYLMFKEYYKYHHENKYKGLYSFKNKLICSDDKIISEPITYDLYFVAVLKRNKINQ